MKNVTQIEHPPHYPDIVFSTDFPRHHRIYDLFPRTFVFLVEKLLAGIPEEVILANPGHPISEIVMLKHSPDLLRRS